MKQPTLLVSVINSLFFSTHLHFPLLSFISDPSLRLTIIMAGVSLSSDIVTLIETVKLRRESIDETARIEALNVAKGLVEALSSPVEKAIQDVSIVCKFAVTGSANKPNVPSSLQNIVAPMALRLGVQLGVFTSINDHKAEGITTKEIAEKAGASPIVVGTLSLPVFHLP